MIIANRLDFGSCRLYLKPNNIRAQDGNCTLISIGLDTLEHHSLSGDPACFGANFQAHGPILGGALSSTGSAHRLVLQLGCAPESSKLEW
jgi:hypothetical protein